MAALFYTVTFINICVEANVQMSYHHADCGACLVLLFRPFSSHSFHQFMVVVSNSKYTVFIGCFSIYSRIYFRSRV